MKKIKLVLGTMNFGPQVDTEDSLIMVKDFLQYGNVELDSAYVYNEGKTENILGDIFKIVPRKSYSIATKVHPRITGSLDKEAISFQFSTSLTRMGIDSVDLLYFHFPDLDTSIDDALEKINDLFLNGKIKEFGLSNFPAWMVVDIWHKCNDKGWITPSVYQGMYNGLCRNVENELFPAIRKLGIRFYAFNPLAGGMLTGKHKSFDEKPPEGRFDRLKSYRNRYWKKSYFEAVGLLNSTCAEFNIKPADAAYRWLTYHSLLSSDHGDGIIIGASNLSQLEQNIIAVDNGPLPDSVLEVFNSVWEEARPESPSYFSFFSKNK